MSKTVTIAMLSIFRTFTSSNKRTTMTKFKELKPFDEKSGEIGQDIILDVPDRVAKNSVRLREVENAVKQAEMGVDMLLDQWKNICTLNEYLDSGDWQADFEADERGEIPTDYPRGVLSEDGLYNVLYRLQDVLEQMSLIVHHIEAPGKK